jgi:hypothetical protein
MGATAKVAEPGTRAYDGTGFAAMMVAELPVGSNVEIVGDKNQGGKTWISVAIEDGRIAYLPGETKVFVIGRDMSLREAYRKTSLSKKSDKDDAMRSMARGALWFAFGAVVTFLTFAANATPFVVIAWGPMLYGIFRFLKGLVVYISTVTD